jgi:pimeloyl-ACP methyl ester carboxylesterase
LSRSGAELALGGSVLYHERYPELQADEGVHLTSASTATSTLTTEVVDGVSVDVVRAGSGKTLLYLHSVDGIHPEAEWFAELSQTFEIVAPWHPGFGLSEWPPEFTSIGDLAYFYLELIRELQIDDAVLVGSSFGGWLACEIAVRAHSAFSHLVLIDPLGIKVGGRQDRDIADMFAVPQEELSRLAYHNPAKRTRDYSTMTEEQLLTIARSREAYAYFGWQPFMHNPSLKRWLRRIRIPSAVVWGASDGIVSPSYGEAFAAEIPGARFVSIPEAGHYPQIEAPRAVVSLIREFAATGATLNSTDSTGV